MERVSPDLWSDLIRANGFGAEAGAYSAEDWLAMVRQAADRTRESRVLEISSGCAAFLYAVHALTGCAVWSIDYSPSLTESARIRQHKNTIIWSVDRFFSAVLANCHLKPQSSARPIMINPCESTPCDNFIVAQTLLPQEPKDRFHCS